MELRLSLALPHDATSVPVVRRILASALTALGVERAAVADIELALTEACANVLEHAGATDVYEVTARIDGDRCIIEVLDRGLGFDADEHGQADADQGAEGGRGIQIMRALVDQVTFSSPGHDGTVVHLEKVLTWERDAPVSRLPDGPARAVATPEPPVGSRG